MCTVVDLPFSPFPFPFPRSLSLWLTPNSFLLLFFLLSPLRLSFLPAFCDCVLVPFYLLPPLASLLSASLILFPLFSFYALARSFSFSSILPFLYSVFCPLATSLSLFLFYLLFLIFPSSSLSIFPSAIRLPDIALLLCLLALTDIVRSVRQHFLLLCMRAPLAGVPFRSFL